MMSLPDFRYKQIAFHIAGGSREKLKFRADNILIEDGDGKVLFQHSCHKLFALFIVGEMSLTSVAIAKSVAFVFPIIMLNRNMKVVATVNCAAEGNTVLRRKQYLADDKNLLVARELIRQKVANQIALINSLRYLAKEDKEARDYLKEVDPRSAADAKELLGIEGNASRVFFGDYFRPLGWVRREPRCKRDIYNLLLDIGYTYLFNFIDAMLCLYGFDRYCGVFHTFFFQRKSLVCDLVEPFRCIIDRRLRKAHNLGQISPDDFFCGKDGVWQLKYSEQTKYIRLFMKDILGEKERIFRFVQSYYRWFVRDKPLSEFPVFKINHEEE